MKILNKYNSIISNLIASGEEYNFIHYRYETDFVNHFKVNIMNLKSLIFNLKNKFKILI